MRVRLGIVGCGGISRLHVAGLRQLTDLIEAVACVDLIEKNAAEKASQLSARYTTTDYRRLLDDPEIDAVDLILPHDQHERVAIEFIRAGKHVLIEKPIAPSLEEADRMIAAARETGVKFMVAQCGRFEPAAAQMKKWIDDGAIGKPFCARVDHNQIIQGLVPPTHWLFDAEKAGGGVTVVSGIHRVDLMRWFLGDIGEVAHFQGDYVLGIRGGEDCGVTIFRFRNGALGEMCANWALVAEGSPWYEATWVYGTEGMIFNMGGLQLCRRGKPPRKIDLPPDNGDAAPFREEIRHFAECILRDTEPLVTGEEGRKSLEGCLAAYESARTGQVVKLPLRLG